jgi:hypothetical protein
MIIRDYKERFALAKEVLTILVGILGTIIGFYFGTATDPAAGNPPANTANTANTANIRNTINNTGNTNINGNTGSLGNDSTSNVNFNLANR